VNKVAIERNFLRTLLVFPANYHSVSASYLCLRRADMWGPFEATVPKQFAVQLKTTLGLWFW